MKTEFLKYQRGAEQRGSIVPSTHRASVSDSSVRGALSLEDSKSIATPIATERTGAYNKVRKRSVDGVN